MLLALASLAWAYYHLGGGYNGSPEGNPVPTQVRGLPIRCLWLGALGGIVISLKGIYDYGSDAWQARFTLWHLGRPFSGAIAGGVTYLLLLAVSGSTPSVPVVMAAAFILGTQEKRFFQFLSEVARLVVQVPGESTEKPLAVKEIRPLAAPTGSALTILGEGFDPGVQVMFKDRKLQDVVVSRDGTTVTGRVPEPADGSDTARILVYNPDGPAFVGTSTLFTYLPNPSPKVLDFGDQPIGTPGRLNVSLRNVAADTMKVNAVKVTTEDPGEFTVPLDSRLPLRLVSDQVYEVVVAFTPAHEGQRTGTLTFETDAGNALEVQLTGHGTP
jgi:hypothetical protein